MKLRFDCYAIASILVLGLAPSHPIVQKQLTVTEVKFESDTRDLSKNVVRGAKKKVRHFAIFSRLLQTAWVSITD